MRSCIYDENEKTVHPVLRYRADGFNKEDKTMAVL